MPPQKTPRYYAPASRKRNALVAQLRKLNRTHALLRELSQMLVRVREPQILLAAACQTLVEKGGFCSAYIYLLDLPTQTARLTATAGSNQAFLASLPSGRPQDPLALDPTAQALWHGQVRVVNDVATEVHLAVWQAQALHLQCRALAAFPLVVGGVVRGALTLTVKTPDFFDAAGLQLLAPMPADLAFMLELMERETERQHIEAALRDSEELFAQVFQHSPVAIALIDITNRTFSEVNAAFLGLVGATRAALVGQSVAQLDLYVDPAARQAVRAVVWSAVQSGNLLYNQEVQICPPQRDPRYMLVSGASLTLRGHRHYLISLVDATERKQAETQLQKQAAHLQALASASQAFANATQDYQALLEHVVRYTSKVYGDYCAIRLFSANGQWLRTAAAYDPDPQRWQAMHAAQLDGDLRANAPELCARVAASGQGVVVAQLTPEQMRALVHPTLWQVLEQFQLHSLIVVPLRAQGRNLGALSLLRFEAVQAAFTEEDLSLAQDLADRAALAIINSNLLQQTQNEIMERIQAEAKIEHQLHRLAALRMVDRAITSSFDFRVTLGILLEHSIAELHVDAAAVFLLNAGLNELVFAAGRGFRGLNLERWRLKLGQGYAGAAALEQRLVCVPNIAQAARSFAIPDLVEHEKFVASYVTPLVAKGQVKGVLQVFHRSPLVADETWLEFLETLAGQAAIAIDNLQLFEGLQRSNMELRLAYDATIEGWSRAMDLRDKETEGHTQRVTELTLQLAQVAGLRPEELVHVRRGALLHDIGKLGVPDAILLKPGPLTAEEWVIMRQHPQYAYDMLVSIEYLRPALDIPYCHHEKWDGTGYPRGLHGAQIPLAARLFAVVDVWDALRSDRPYRAGWSAEKVLAHLQAGAGTHFDPEAVAWFLQVMQEQPA